jgi:hypothetical protein
MTNDAGILSSTFVPYFLAPSSIVVGNGSFMPVTTTGATALSPSIRLNNVLVSPQLIKNLISVLSSLPLTTIVLSSLTHLVAL